MGDVIDVEHGSWTQNVYFFSALFGFVIFAFALPFAFAFALALALSSTSLGKPIKETELVFGKEVSLRDHAASPGMLGEGTALTFQEKARYSRVTTIRTVSICAYKLRTSWRVQQIKVTNCSSPPHTQVGQKAANTVA